MMVSFLMSGIVVVIIVSPIFAHFIGKDFQMVLINIPKAFNNNTVW